MSKYKKEIYPTKLRRTGLGRLDGRYMLLIVWKIINHKEKQNKMIPKEKAKELVNKYTTMIFNSGCTVSKPMVKQCALIAVNTVIQSYKDDTNSGYTNDSIKNNKKYWQQVKQGIKNL